MAIPLARSRAANSMYFPLMTPVTGAWTLERNTRLDKRCVSIAIQGRTQGGLATPPYYGGHAISVLIQWKGSDVTPYAKRPVTGQRERIVKIPFSNYGCARKAL